MDGRSTISYPVSNTGTVDFTTKGNSRGRWNINTFHCKHISMTSSFQPRQTFVYRFFADPPGSHWYHSHLVAQRRDGLYGALIIHKQLPQQPYFTLLTSDWSRAEARTHSTTNPFALDSTQVGAGDLFADPSRRDTSVDGIETGAYIYDSAIINGRGRSGDRRYPLARFILSTRITHTIHVMNVGGDFAYEIEIDGHALRIVAVDGESINPVTVDSVIINPGETIDVELDPNYWQSDNTGGQYWIRAHTLREGSGPDVFRDGVIREVRAVLIYAGASPLVDPSSFKRRCTVNNPCLTYNCPYAGYPTSYYKRCISAADVASINQHVAVTRDNVVEYFFNVALVNGPSINGVRFIPPRVPLFERFTTEDVVQCNKEDCEDGCECSHFITLPFNKTIQFVISNFDLRTERRGRYSHHPFHLHGHHFAVVKMGFPNYNKNTGLQTRPNADIFCNSAICNSPRWSGRPPIMNLQRPPVKDTIVVPAGGYVVLRFISDNPGFWLLHCHMDSHSTTGMLAVLHSSPEFIPDIPPSFPRCGHFRWTEQAFDRVVRSHPLLRNLSSEVRNNNDAISESDTTSELQNTDQVNDDSAASANITDELIYFDDVIDDNTGAENTDTINGYNFGDYTSDDVEENPSDFLRVGSTVTGDIFADVISGKQSKEDQHVSHSDNTAATGEITAKPVVSLEEQQDLHQTSTESGSNVCPPVGQ